MHYFDVASVRFAVSTVVVESIKTGPLTPYRFRALGTAEMAHGNTLAWLASNGPRGWLLWDPWNRQLGPGDVTSRDSEHKGVSGTLLGQFNLVRLCQTEILWEYDALLSWTNYHLYCIYLSLSVHWASLTTSWTLILGGPSADHLQHQISQTLQFRST